MILQASSLQVKPQRACGAFYGKLVLKVAATGWNMSGEAA